MSYRSSQQNLYDICLLLCVQSWTRDDGQRDCPKYVEFHSKNKFEKLVQLVGFVIRIFPVIFFSPMADSPSGPRPPRCWGFENTIRHTALGRTPLDEWSARRRDLYLAANNTQQQTDIQAPGGIRNHNPSRRANAERRLRSRCLRHWLASKRTIHYSTVNLSFESIQSSRDKSVLLHARGAQRVPGN